MHGQETRIDWTRLVGSSDWLRLHPERIEEASQAPPPRRPPAAPQPREHPRRPARRIAEGNDDDRSSLLNVIDGLVTKSRVRTFAGGVR